MSDVDAAVRRWLESVVIGLNLCPFAAGPYRRGQVRITVTDASTDEAVLEAMEAELGMLAATPAAEVETTVLVIPAHLATFEAYNRFLDAVDVWLVHMGWEGTFQVASFHPDYQFEGTAPGDDENLTNRSPYPILHIIREASIDAALARYDNPEAIPQRNIARVRSLTGDERKRLFPYLSY